jgi:hypothetical protein
MVTNMTEAQHARERAQRARDYRETVALIEAAVGVPPALVGRLAEIEVRLADQAARIEAQEARIAVLEAQPAECEDGVPRASGRWCKTAEAMRLTGYSRSGLRKLRQQNRIVFDFSGPHCLYDVTSVVRRVCKVPA